MKFAHTRALALALPAWTFAVAWVWPRAARAEALSSEVHTYDWTSVAYAGGLGLLGGGLALMVALATDKRVVTEVFRESARNAFVSPLGGILAFPCLKAGTALDLFSLTTEPRFLVIVASGYAGIALIEWVRSLFTAGAPRVRDGLIEWGVSWLKGRSGPKGE
jgi:hypothetical protein